jgi:hypothetical protein
MIGIVHAIQMTVLIHATNKLNTTDLLVLFVGFLNESLDEDRRL